MTRLRITRSLSGHCRCGTGVLVVTGLLVIVVWPRYAQAAESLQVGEEIPVRAAGQGEGVRGTPHVAFGGGRYLAVWREGWHGEGGRARICAARLDPQGQVLDRQPIEIAAAADAVQDLPRVAFGGGVFLVVWQEFRLGRDCDVLGARISPEGQRLDAQPIPIATGPRTQSAPDVASRGQDFLVAWHAAEGDENAFRVKTSRVAADGRVQPAAEIKSPWTKAAACPRLAWDGDHYRLVFVSQSLLSVRLAPDGSPMEQEPFVTLRSHLGSAIRFAHAVAAAPDRGMLAVFTRSQPDYWGWGGPGAMICWLTGPDGKPDAGIPREDHPQSKLPNWLDFGKDKQDGSPWPYGSSAVAWDGKQFVAMWQRYHIAKTVSLTNCDLIAACVEGWRPLDDPGVAVAVTDVEEKSPALASAGAGKLLCVYEKHGRDGQIAIVARVLGTR